jgi:aminoglycoside/choline kinase family phosphotransferase
MVSNQIETYVIDALIWLFRAHFGMNPEQIAPLPGAGSDRKYFRISAGHFRVVASHNPDIADHKAFLYLCRHFLSQNLPVPQVLGSNLKEGTCLLQDLGDETLLVRIEKIRTEAGFEAKLMELYRSALSDLISFQVQGHKSLDYKQLPVPQFDAQSMHWDLNYFKYYFLKPSGILFDEKTLQIDFDALVNFLQQESLQGFMYRDFQARNIMLHDDKLYYIDFQGGRKGPLQYDVASLLFQAKAALPDHIKDMLISFYISRLQNHINFDAGLFSNSLKGFILLRLLQVMGAYGFRGWFKGKSHFLESIPLLKSNLVWIAKQKDFSDNWPELSRMIAKIIESMENSTLASGKKLIVSINSFSFRRGVPYDPTGHGGGFVFDCRLLPNPGRQEVYRQLTGKDEAVVDYLEKEPMVPAFLDNILKIVHQSVSSYKATGYNRLQLNFGCTGGRHRSVFCAERLAAILGSDKNIEIVLKHRDLANF